MEYATQVLKLKCYFRLLINRMERRNNEIFIKLFFPEAYYLDLSIYISVI